MRDKAGSAAAPAARCKNARRGSFILNSSSAFASFDHLVGAQHERSRGVMTDRFCCLEIDQLEPRRLLDRQIGRLDAAQQLGELPAQDVSVQLNDQRSVSDEALSVALASQGGD